MLNGYFCPLILTFPAIVMVKNVMLPFLLLFSLPLFSQDTIYHHQYQSINEITYVPRGVYPFANSNQIVTKLAAALDVHPGSLAIQIRSEQTIDIVQHPRKNPVLVFTLYPEMVTFAPSYRNFDLRDALVPDRFSVTFQLISIPDSNILREYSVYDHGLNDLPGGCLRFELPVFDPVGHGIAITKVNWYYSDQVLEKYTQRITNLDDYYAVLSITDTLTRFAHNMDLTDMSSYPVYFVELLEMKKMLKLIEEKKILQELNLMKQDPEGLIPRLRELDKLTRSLSMTFEERLTQTEKIPWNHSVRDPLHYYLHRIQWYIHRSTLMNGIKGSIYQEYLDTYFRIHGFHDDLEMVQLLLRRMYPGNDGISSVSMVSGLLWNRYQLSALEWIRSQHYTDAWKLLQHAHDYSLHNPFFRAPEDSLHLTEMAVSGIYASFIGIAETCLKVQKFDLAEEYLQKALHYRISYQRLIPSDTMFQRVFGSLFNQRLTDCDTRLGMEEFEDALACYASFENDYPDETRKYVINHLDSKKRMAWRGLFFRKYSRIDELLKNDDPQNAILWYDDLCKTTKMLVNDREVQAAFDAITERILPVRYLQLIEQGTAYYIRRKYEQAYHLLLEAKQIGDALNLEPDSMFQFAFIQTCKHHLLNDISLSTGMIWNNKFDSARLFISGVNNVMDVYNLRSDPELQAAIVLYRKKIDNQLCYNCRQEIELNLIRAYRNIERKRFDQAVTQFGQIKLTMTRRPECGFSFPFISDTIQKYLSAAFFQEKESQILQLIQIGEYQEAIQLFTDNERFYQVNGLGQFGIPYLTMDEFLANMNHIPLTREAVYYYYIRKDYPKAFLYLGYLKILGVSSGDVGDMQEQLGREMAIKECRKGSAISPASQVLTLTGGNRWFAKFGQTYLSTCRILMKD